MNTFNFESLKFHLVVQQRTKDWKELNPDELISLLTVCTSFLLKAQQKIFRRAVGTEH